MVSHFVYTHRCLIEKNVPIALILPSRWQDGAESLGIEHTSCLWFYQYSPVYLLYLCSACLRGNLRMSMFLVEKGADVNLKDDEHHTPLHLSAQVIS